MCWAVTGKCPIGTRWIDINKGDDSNPVHRSRLVDKEFNNEVMEGIVAGTPPLEALGALVHEAALCPGLPLWPGRGLERRPAGSERWPGWPR